jgi:hypothetical protein
MTPRFNWLSQYEVHPLVEAITKKFTMKMEYKIVERKLLRTQSPNTLKSHYYTIEIIPQKRIQKTEIQNRLLLETDGGWSLFSLTL